MIPALTRRHLLLNGASMIAAPALASFAALLTSALAAPGDGFRILRARSLEARANGGTQPPATVWGYDGESGVPLIRATRGEEVRLRLVNELPQPTALHWHGVRIANAMDGVPHLTQPPVDPGESFDYRFIVPDAGTFWFHPPHSVFSPRASIESASASAPTLEQLLAGVLIVDHPDRADVDQDVIAFIEQRPHRGGGALRVNRAAVHDVAVRTNERLRLRLINATDQMLALRFDRHGARVMAIDGQPAEPFVARDGRMSMGPGNRIDVFVDAELDPGTAAALVLDDDGRPLVRLIYAPGAPGRPAPRPAPSALPANPLPEQMDFAGAMKLDLPLDAASARNTHSEAPLFSVKRGRTVMLALVNRTDARCATHLHGHHFRLLDRLDDGWKPFWLDTLTMPPRRTSRIAFVADNPGKWLVESRFLDGHKAGPAVWFEVA